MLNVDWAFSHRKKINVIAYYIPLKLMNAFIQEILVVS